MTGSRFVPVLSSPWPPDVLTAARVEWQRGLQERLTFTEFCRLATEELARGECDARAAVLRARSRLLGPARLRPVA